MVQMDSEDLTDENAEETELFGSVAHKAVQMLAQFVPMLHPQDRAHIFSQLRAQNPHLYGVI